MLNVYKNQQIRQTGSRNLMGPKTLPTIWGTYMKLVTKYQISAINSCWEKCDEKLVFIHIERHIFLSNYWQQKSDIWSQGSYRYPISWEAFLDPSDSYFLIANFVDFDTHWTYMLIFRRIFLSNYLWSLWPNIRFLPSTVTEKNVTKNILDGWKDSQTDRGKTVYPSPPSGSGGIIINTLNKQSQGLVSSRHL
jgi:hypothetical protein